MVVIWLCFLCSLLTGVAWIGIEIANRIWFPENPLSPSFVSAATGSFITLLTQAMAERLKIDSSKLVSSLMPKKTADTAVRLKGDLGFLDVDVDDER